MSTTRTTRNERSRSKVRRLPKRASYDRKDIHSIIDEALICHVGISDADQPIVIPTIHARQGDRLLLHGLKGGRLLEHIEAGNAICVAMTLLDGVVLARSAFHHSLNYRSVVIFGHGELVEDDADKLEALKTISDHVAPGRWKDARSPNAKELKVTSVISLVIDEASAKVRSGPPLDDDADYELPIWAGVVPLRLCAQTPQDDGRVQTGIEVPDYAASYVRNSGHSSGALSDRLSSSSRKSAE